MVAHDCPWYSDASYNAARVGHLHILKWIFDNNHLWDDLNVCLAAATGGHLEVLQWARTK